MRYIRKTIVILFVAALAGYFVTTICISGKKDTTAPVITCDREELEVTSEASEEDLLSGLKATDDRDGDITDKIRIGSHSKFISKGVCEITYLVFDSSYNAGQYTRKVVYTDYESPKFSLTDALVYNINSDVTMLDRIRAYDVIDGDISDKLKIVSSNINVSQEGTYTVGIEVANDYSDVASLELPVHVIDGEENAPSIQLETYLVYVKAGDAFEPDKYLKEAVISDGNPIDTDSVTIDSRADTSRPGIYEVIYSCTDQEGRTGYSYLIVAVTE